MARSGKAHKRIMAPKGGLTYRRVWRIVRGAVADALTAHPEYVAQQHLRAAQESIIKRVTGAVVSSFPERGGVSGKTGD